jgi:hypothetical protein
VQAWILAVAARGASSEPRLDTNKLAASTDCKFVASKDDDARMPERMVGVESTQEVGLILGEPKRVGLQRCEKLSLSEPEPRDATRIHVCDAALHVRFRSRAGV